MVECEVSSGQDISNRLLTVLIENITTIIEKHQDQSTCDSDIDLAVKSKLVPLLGGLLINQSAICTRRTCQLVTAIFKRLRQHLVNELYTLISCVVLPTMNSINAAFY